MANLSASIVSLILVLVLQTLKEKGQRLVLICDGAPWLKNWFSDSFPQAVQILDLYHALEYLHEFKSAHFTNEQKTEAWAQKQKALLLKSEVKKVLQNIKRLKSPHKEAAQKIIHYYESNTDRMDYARYVNIGCGIIGSGAIESSHKTVIQHRMKQAGQRWTIEGAQNMLNLRVLKENHQWSKVINMAKYGFNKAA